LLSVQQVARMRDFGRKH